MGLQNLAAGIKPPEQKDERHNVGAGGPLEKANKSILSRQNSVNSSNNSVNSQKVNSSGNPLMPDC